MATVVTVAMDHGRSPEADHLFAELAHWADGAAGIEWKREGDVIDVTFPADTPTPPFNEVCDVLSAANPAWGNFVGVQAAVA